MHYNISTQFVFALFVNNNSNGLLLQKIKLFRCKNKIIVIINKLFIWLNIINNNKKKEHFCIACKYSF